MKQLFTILGVLLIVLSLSAQDTWQFQGALPADSSLTGIHGIAVDPDGKIWVHNYTNFTDSVSVNDTLRSGAGIHVYNPDGSEVEWSPVMFATIGEETDTLCGYSDDSTGAWVKLSSRGLRADADGNILVSLCELWPYINEQVFVYKLDYTDGSAMAKLNLSHEPADGAKANAACATALTTGNFFTGYLYPGFPVEEYDSDFNLLGTAFTSVSFTAAFSASDDGNTVYWTSYAAQQCYIFNRPDEFSAFALVDSLGQGLTMHTSALQPTTGYLWLSSSNTADTTWQKNGWYAIDVNTKARMDSMFWHNPVGDMTLRALDFSADGLTAYGGAQNGACGAQIFQKLPAGLGWEYVGTIGDYSLSHNYPNPFNPSTEIRFTIGQPGHTTFKVYNMLGQEVASLIDADLQAGNYTVTFDASKLSSGTYVYELRSKDKVMSKKMTLVK